MWISSDQGRPQGGKARTQVHLLQGACTEGRGGGALAGFLEEVTRGKGRSPGGAVGRGTAGAQDAGGCFPAMPDSGRKGGPSGPRVCGLEFSLFKNCF